MTLLPQKCRIRPYAFFADFLTSSWYLVIPYHPAEQPIHAPEGFDGTYYPPNMESVPKKLAIVRANRAMVDSCGYLIVYVIHPASNAATLLDYTRKKQIKVIHLNGRESSL